MTVRSARRLTAILGHRVLLLCFIAFAIFPFYWMVVTTFKQNADLYVGATNVQHNPFLFNRPPTLEHLRTLFGQTLYTTWLCNTLWVGVVVVVVTLGLAVPAGYSLARLTGRWGERLSIGIFLTYLVPSTLLFIPFSRLVSLLGLQNSLWSLVLIYPTFTVPFCTWLLMGFFKSLPREVEESAMVDGCTRTQAFVKVIFPLLAPGLMATSLFGFVTAWNEFPLVLILNKDIEKQTLPLWLSSFQTTFGDDWGATMAAASLFALPILILFVFLQRKAVSGLTSGAVKG